MGKIHSVGSFLGFLKSLNLRQLGSMIAIVSVIIIVAATSTTGCAEPNNDVNDDNRSGSHIETSKFPMTVTDQAGRTVTIESEPQKIVSLAPSDTEILFALGLGHKIVGVTTYCNYPEEALEKIKIGGYSTVDTEAVTAVQPDLILAANYHVGKVVPAMESLGFTVLVLDPKTVDDVMAAITFVGTVTGSESEAFDLVSILKTRVEAVRSKTQNLTTAQRTRVLYLVAYDPMWAANTDNLIDNVIGIAGGSNILSDQSGYGVVGMETVIGANPEVIIAGSSMGSHGTALAYLNSEQRLAITDALINGQVYEITSDIISRPGPRIVDALEIMAKMIHPEIFGSAE